MANTATQRHRSTATRKLTPTQMRERERERKRERTRQRERERERERERWRRGDLCEEDACPRDEHPCHGGRVLEDDGHGERVLEHEDPAQHRHLRRRLPSGKQKGKAADQLTDASKPKT